MICMSDFDIFFRFHKTDKMSISNYQRECLNQAFSSKNVGPEKVVRNLSGSLYLNIKMPDFWVKTIIFW